MQNYTDLLITVVLVNLLGLWGHIASFNGTIRGWHIATYKLSYYSVKAFYFRATLYGYGVKSPVKLLGPWYKIPRYYSKLRWRYCENPSTLLLEQITMEMIHIIISVHYYDDGVKPLVHY